MVFEVNIDACNDVKNLITDLGFGRSPHHKAYTVVLLYEQKSTR